MSFGKIHSIQKIHEGQKSSVYRGRKNNQKLIIKSLNSNFPHKEEIEQFKREYEILKEIQNIKGIIEVEAFEIYHNRYCMIFKDIGGVSLDKYLGRNKKFQVGEFLIIAESIVRIMQELHRINLIHKDIKPHNIIYNQENNYIELIDFGYASFLNKEVPLFHPIDNLIGTINYISPEQTGRVHGPVDLRSDLYSMGITFYQLLTGELPFSSNDIFEVIQGHIAEPPIPPNEKEKDIPKILSNMIMKLMEKNPDNRYQNEDTLLNDILECKVLP